jgi:hypothetical protein
MGIGTPKDLTECTRFFLEPGTARQRIYEALRAYFVEHRPTAEVARAFGYTEGAFRVMCHHFRREPDPVFFVERPRGPQKQPKKSAATATIVALRKQNHSVYEISEALADQGQRLSPTAVREVLRSEGFAALPRRLDEERPQRPRPTIEPVADVRAFALTSQRFTTPCGGLFLFVPALVELRLAALATAAGLPGSQMIPAAHALRAALALKLWSIERKSHVMALVADSGLALFAGLNAFPKKSYLSEYASRIDHQMTVALLADWQQRVAGQQLFTADSLNLDFHSVPYYGDHPVVERHYISRRGRAQKSVLVFLAQDADSHAFCYANADLRKGEEAEEVFHFLAFWQRVHHDPPRQLVFDCDLTTLQNLARLDRDGVHFLTLRRRSPKLLQEVYSLPRAAWRTIELDAPTRAYRTPRIYEQKVTVAGCRLRQLYIQDLGHEQPTILLTNEPKASAKQIVTRYAQRMLIENALSDAVRFFHMDALSSAVGLKTDFDMALLVVASGLYRLLARRMRGYAEAQARQLFRDIIQMPAEVTVDPTQVTVRFYRRAHLPIIMASGLLDQPVTVPWWNQAKLTLTT